MLTAMNVLLVDDEPLVLALARRMIEREGLRVLATDSPIAALRIADLHPDIDLLVTDLMMASMSGLELAEQLRASHPQTRVMYMSGYPVEATSRAVPGEFLKKPFSREELALALRRVLAHHGRDP